MTQQRQHPEQISADRIAVRRVYDDPGPDDGTRVLVDRLWPRGLSKEEAKVDEWLRDIAPSNELRKWYEHDPAKWDEFRRRYADELADHQPLVQQLRDQARAGQVTLLYSSREERLNNAVALREYLLSRQDDGRA